MNPISSAPLDGSIVNIHFPDAAGRIVTSCTRYLPSENRWNGMCRGETPLGWTPADTTKTTQKAPIDPFS